MGSLTSRPSVPAPQPPVIVSPPPAPVQPVTPTSTDDKGSSEQSASEARQQSLLGRSRGRFGTVQTSFRGLLGLSDNSAQRKTLLGE